jgi:hypothetical protein
MALFSSKKDREKYKDVNYLELTPYRLYEHEQKEDGLINILVPKFTNKIMANLLMPRIRHPYIKANMDEIGTATWLEIDGQQNVRQIADNLAEKFGDKIQPVYERLTMFLTQLYKAGFILFKEIERK